VEPAVDRLLRKAAEGEDAVRVGRHAPRRGGRRDRGADAAGVSGRSMTKGGHRAYCSSANRHSFGSDLALGGDCRGVRRGEAAGVAERTPRAPVHRALLLRARRRDPLEETVHVEDVRALAPDCARRQRPRSPSDSAHTQRAVVPGHLARGAARLVRHAADPAHVLLVLVLARRGRRARVPAPGRHRFP
jgi:hypothetical protein